HGGHSLAKAVNFGFAKSTNSVPLNGIEFSVAQRHYPIVFTNEGPPFPMAVLGLRNDENLFVGVAGDWAERGYVPAYVRRYPFIFLTGPDEKKFALCIDTASPLIVEGGDNPFFAGGQPTDLTRNALNFCSAFQAEYEKTKPFCAALLEHGVLESRAADLSVAGVQKLVFGTFRVVNEAKLAALPNAVLADWQRRGWLGWIHAHLFSFANWMDLASRIESPAAGAGDKR
ncbi:MAG: SapC family protein, partial [Alphaproteobacteria bacterium]